MKYSALVVTVSDRSFNGLREDISGMKLLSLLSEGGYETSYEIVPDEESEIKKILFDYCDRKVNLILTTGGTGLAKRDVTPQATLSVAEKRVPGISELLRSESMKKTPFGALSRGESVVRGETLIINLPGSPDAVCECYEVLQPMLIHAIKTILGEDTGH